MSYEEDEHDYFPPATSFERTYRCYPACFIEKPHLEKGDKIIMPPSALDQLAFLQIDYPMLFEINNPSSGRFTHCGVMEFIADEGLIYLPYWMMQNMLLEEGDIVCVKNKSLSKGTYVKLQPHTKDFLDITNPKAVLETSLRSFSCLTTGDTINVSYNNKMFYIDVIETKPASAVCIIETDCEVDFAPPLDYEGPEKWPQSVPDKKLASTEGEEEPPRKAAKFNPFAGPGRRLDGKASISSEAPVPIPAVKEDQSPPTSRCNQRKGKLVFGSGTSQALNGSPTLAPKAGEEVKSEVPPSKVEEPKFKAFTGKKHSLKS